MPFRDVADPEKLAMLHTVVNDICHEAGIEPGSAEYEEAACMVMRFYWAGYRTADQLRAALDKAMGWERYG
jgi:hypothetical protein